MPDRTEAPEGAQKPQPIERPRQNEAPRPRKPGWRDLTRAGDDAPSGTFRIPRI